MTRIARPEAPSATHHSSMTYNTRLARLGAVGRWTAPNENQSWSPRPVSVPMLWPYNALRPMAVEAADFVKGAAGALRVVTLVNPGTAATNEAAVGLLYSGLQIVKSGEEMTAHRHAAAAVRFVVEGNGGWTMIDGDRIPMRPRDFVVTPTQQWHEHGNDSTDGLVIWQDGTTDPLTAALDANFFELHPDTHQIARGVPNCSLIAYGSGSLQPDSRRSARDSPLLSYPWDKSYDTLLRYARGAQDSPYDGVIMEYANASNGKSVTPVMGAHLQLLRPGQSTLAHRHTGSVVYHVAQGRGYSIVSGRRFDWSEHDVFCIPSWAWHEHTKADPTNEACLFSFNDFPTLRNLGLFSEQALPTGSGHQEIATATSTSTPPRRPA